MDQQAKDKFAAGCARVNQREDFVRIAKVHAQAGDWILASIALRTALEFSASPVTDRIIHRMITSAHEQRPWWTD